MAAYRKKPIVIDAQQYFGDLIPGVCNCAEMGDGSFHVHTLEGPLRVSREDWIIKGVKDEYYPCKPDIFAVSYEKAED